MVNEIEQLLALYEKRPFICLSNSEKLELLNLTKNKLEECRLKYFDDGK